MTHSTFSAQVANNLLTLLQGYSKTIRLLLVMFLTLTASAVWGEDFEEYSGTITEGDYLIVYSNGAMKNTVSSDRLQYSDVTVSNNKISNPDVSLIWHIAPSGNYWTIYNASVNKYAAGTGAKNKAQLLASGTDDKSLWTVSGTSTYEFVNKANKAAGVNSNLRKNGTYGFACYATGTGGALTLYKKVTSAPSFTITATSNNNNYGTVSVSGTTITASPKTGYTYANPAYTVTEGTATVTQNGNTFTVNPSTNCTVRINFAAKPKYTVTFNAGSGSCSTSSLTESTAGAGVTLPTATICDGWEFAGWKETSAISTETTTAPTLLSEGSNYKPTNNCTLYAVYKRTETTSGVGGDNTSVTFTDEDSGGWTTTAGEQNGTKDGVSISTTNGIYSQNNNQLRVYKDATFTVSSENIITSIVFSSSNYDWSDTSDGDYSSKTWTGNTKSVTFTASNGQVRITQIVVTISAGGTTSTTYYHSSPDCGGSNSGYTITYVTNGGTKVESTSGTALPNSLPTTTRDHYTFAGWFTNEGCTQAATAGATINANTTLYAKWTPITYTVTFDAGSGTCATEPTQGNFETGLELPTATPCSYASTNGWSFVGWSETTVSETTVRPAIHTDNYKPTKNITLHAVYAKTGTAEGAVGEFILSLEYKGTTYYVGQTFDNSKLSAETEQTNAARFTIEDNYLHYEGGYISHVATQSSTNITRQTDKAKAQAWTITEEANTIIFTSTADATRGLGFNYNDGSPRFAAYQLSNVDYPHTFTKTSVSGGNIQVTTYNSNPSCVAPVNPTWKPATINFDGIIQVECGSKTLLNAADPNGPATITFNGYDLQNSVIVTASDGFLISTNETVENTYKQEVTVNPHKDGQNIGKIQNVYVIAQAPAQSGDYTGTITLTGNDIPGRSQVINVTAAVTCTQYTITWSVNGDETQKTTFYAGGEWMLPADPTFDCNGRVFVGWTNNEIVQPQDFAPNVLYKEQGEFPTIESNTTFYAVFAKKGTDDGSGNSGDTKTVTLPRPSKTANGYQVGTTVDSEENTWSYYATLSNQSGTFCYGLNSHSNNYHISSPIFGGTIKSISFKAHNGSSSANRKFLFCSSNTTAQPTTGDLAEVTIPKSESFSQIYTADLSQLGVNQFHIYVAAALSITDIAVTYTTGSSTSSTTYTSYTTSCADVKAIRIVEPTTKTFNEGDKFVFDGEVWAINSDDTETNVTHSSLVHFVYDMNKVGTQTVTVSYLTFTATYEITINAVDKWQLTWNVSGATNTGLSPAAVAKGNAIGKLPNPKAIPDGCDGKTFVGWTESNTVNLDGTEITFITSSTVPTQNTTYYAVFAAPSGNAGNGDYVKLTETPADLSGEYLIVYEAGNLAFNGGLTTLDAASNTIGVTINDNTIESTDATNAAKFTITKNGDAYIITSASNYHIGQTSNANGLLSSKSTSYTNTITITEGDADIIGSGGAYLRYNKASGDTRFRYYKSSTYTGQQPIALYKQSGSSASYTDYTTGCHDVTITYYGFTGGYTTNCGGSDLNVITTRVNSAHTIPSCADITDPTTLGRTFLNLWKDQNGKVHQPGETFIVTQDITLYAQWKLETTGDIELPADKEDLATTDIIVTGGKTLTIPEGETITINSLTLKGGLIGDGKSGNYAMPSVWVPEGATLVRNNTTINLDLVVNSKSWYPFAVPFAATINANVEYLHPTLAAASEYGTHFAIKTYDGERRAEEGVDQTNNWVQRNRNEKLQPGVGYIISALTFPNKDTATIRIPMTVDNAWLADGEQESITVKEQTTTRNQVAVTAHTGTAAKEHQRHAGWNFVANPYLSMFAGGNVANDVAYIKGSINIQNKYTYEDTEVTYVTVPACNFAYYEQFKLSATKLSPAYSFFVQVGTDGTMTFETAGRQQAPASIAARNAEERPVKMDVDITLSDNHSSDLTGIIISDRYNDTYEIGRDLEKLFGSAYNLSVYTLMADNTPLAYQALAIRSSMQVIPVGYRAPAQGEYTFRLNEATSSIDLLNEQYEQLVLVDYQTGALTNLLNSDYTFYSERTQADNRFAIYAVPRQNAPTDLPNAIGQDKEAQKIIHNGHLYILRNGNVYNGAGQMVK